MTTRGKPMVIRVHDDGTLDPRVTITGLAMRRGDSSDRHPRAVLRERIAEDLNAYLERGGKIQRLPGPGEWSR